MINLKGSEIMRGQYRKWSKEEKLRIVNRYVVDHVGQPTLAREEEISEGMLRRWIYAFLENGEKGLEPKKYHRGNPFAALHTSKSLSEIDRLRLENAKQKIEIERLKKGYIVKGAGANKEFVTLNERNSKSLKD